MRDNPPTPANGAFGFQLNRTALYWAAFNDRLKTAEVLVDFGADMDIVDSEVSSEQWRCGITYPRTAPVSTLTQSPKCDKH